MVESKKGDRRTRGPIPIASGVLFVI